MLQSQYPSLTQNGKLFPSWIVYNFKKYKIPKQTLATDIDGCIQQEKRAKLELRNYQIFLSKYLDYNSPYSSILLYHGLGSGKTATAIGIYNNLYNSYNQWNVFILLKASLKKSTWAGNDERSGELGLWLSNDDKENRWNNIKFLSYDSPTADKQFQELIKQSDMSKKNLYIIDEAHNFIRNVYNNIVTQKGKRAQYIYDYIIHEKKENPFTKIVLISATPIINEVYELGLMFNLLKPDLFPKNEIDFNNLFIDPITNNTINQDNLNTFQRRILGLVSFYESIDPTVYAKKNIHFVDIKISKYQQDILKYYISLETKSQQYKTRSKTESENQTYRTFSRQACNFVFPTISGISGEHRPRPSQFNISEKDASDIIRAKFTTEITTIKGKIEKKYMNKEGYLKSMEKYINTFKNYIEEYNKKDKENNYTIEDDIKNILNKIKDITQTNNIIETLINSKKVSNVLNALYECSAKYVCMCFIILQSPGPVLMYSNYVLMEGIQIFKIYLNWFGFASINSINENKENPKKSKNTNLEILNNKKYDYKRYTEYHGGMSQDERTFAKNMYNKKENNHGQIIKIIMISPAGTEGISLNHVRQIHITEPHWNEVRITQMIGRGVRLCSHRYLPINERIVDVYRYKSITPEYQTTDQFVENIALNKEQIIQSFLHSLKEAAVDCELNIEMNKLNNNIKCFKFNEKDLLNKQITQAYKMDLIDDLQISSGMNSKNSIEKQIKVVKINCVIETINKLNDNNNDNENILEKVSYSDSNLYWVNTETGAVYDLDYYYLVGQLKIDKDNNFVKYDDKVFIINKLVFYPKVKIV